MKVFKIRVSEWRFQREAEFIAVWGNIHFTQIHQLLVHGQRCAQRNRDIGAVVFQVSNPNYCRPGKISRWRFSPDDSNS